MTRASFDFTSIADYVFSSACKYELSIAFIGGSQNEIEKATQYIQKRYVNIKISYYHNGFIHENELENILNTLSKNKTDIVICGMGTPLQEEFLIRIKKAINIKILITCGGFLTQTSMFGDYYHPIIKKLGLRWLQRAILHKHVRDRLIKVYPEFLLSYLLNRKIK
nr:WecB/TagA/CpsF family glycosyltransferase [Providencia sp. PROV029]